MHLFTNDNPGNREVEESMNWHLSPRWRIRNDSQPLLIGPDNQRLLLEPLQYEAIRGGRLLLSPLVSATEFSDILKWARQLIDSRTLVPDYLALGLSGETEAENFYLEVFEALCRHISSQDILPNLRAGILCWSGSVLKQPLGAPRDYLPSRPSLCIDLLGNARRSVRVALDCRDPLNTPWENILLARRTFEMHVKHRTDLFHRMCELVFQDPSHFMNPRVKYLHPAIEYLPDGEVISAYWNLGRAKSRQELWNRNFEIVEAMGGSIERQICFRNAFGAVSQPELIGHTFDPGKPSILKTYIMFDGLNRETLLEIMELEKVSSPGVPVLEAFQWLERNGLLPGRNLGIASLYHPLDGNARPGIKIHLNLQEGFERRFSLDEIVGIVSKNIPETKLFVKPLPDNLSLGDGRLVKVTPNTLSFTLLPDEGLTKITLYVGFLG